MIKKLSIFVIATTVGLECMVPQVVSANPGELCRLISEVTVKEQWLKLV